MTSLLELNIQIILKNEPTRRKPNYSQPHQKPYQTILHTNQWTQHSDKTSKVHLNCFPNSVTVWSNNHSTPDRAIIGELGVGNDVEIPGIEVLWPRRYGSFGASIFGHRGNLLLGGEIGGGEKPRTEADTAVSPENRRWPGRDAGRRRRRQDRGERV